MKRTNKMIAVLMITLMGILLSNGALFSSAKNDLVQRFAELLKFDANYFERQKSQADTKITSLFVRSSEKNSIDLTMLIAYDKNITKAAQTLTDERVTPLILSVSTMPFIETHFEPSDFSFEQEGIRWSPKKDENSFDMFPLGENGNFGGEINDAQLQQGVILLPGAFDVTRPIKITYKNFKKVCLLK